MIYGNRNSAQMVMTEAFQLARLRRGANVITGVHAYTGYLNLETHETLTSACPLRAERRRDVHISIVSSPRSARDG
jgi:hypothetical protein